MDYGPKKPLNWRPPVLEEPVKKALSHEEKLAIHSQAGTPPTRRGSFNGAAPGLKPALTPELNPPLRLSKAVTAPVKTDPASGKQQFARKRGEDGKFVDAENSGSESTAQEDSEKQERAAKLQQHKMNDKLVDVKQRASEVSRGKTPKNPSVKDNHEKDGRIDKALGGAQVPGMPSAMPIDTVNDPVSKQIGVSQTGNPIYDDPHHSEHADFSPQDHQDAAQASQQAAQAAMAQGDQAGAMRLANNATTHQSMGSDSSNPSARFMDNLNTPNGQAPMMDDLPQDDLSNLMGGSAVQSTSSPVGQPQGAPPPQDPMMGMGASMQPPQDPMQAPMGSSPMMPAPPSPDMSAPAMPSSPPPQDPLADPMGQPSSPPPADALSSFVDPAGDQNKPVANPAVAGPAPGMLNSQTGAGTGPQTDAGAFAGTANQPVPDAAASSPVPPVGDQPVPQSPGMEDPGMGGDPMDQGGDDAGALDLDTLFGDSGSEDSGMPDEGEEEAADEGNPFGGGDESEPQDEESEADDDGGNPFEKDDDKEKVEAAVAKALRALARLG